MLHMAYLKKCYSRQTGQGRQFWEALQREPRTLMLSCYLPRKERAPQVRRGAAKTHKPGATISLQTLYPPSTPWYLPREMKTRSHYNLYTNLIEALFIIALN